MSPALGQRSGDPPPKVSMTRGCTAAREAVFWGHDSFMKERFVVWFSRACFCFTNVKHHSFSNAMLSENSCEDHVLGVCMYHLLVFAPQRLPGNTVREAQ